jgi:hypothetical protein
MMKHCRVRRRLKSPDVALNNYHISDDIRFEA